MRESSFHKFARNLFLFLSSFTDQPENVDDEDDDDEDDDDDDDLVENDRYNDDQDDEDADFLGSQPCFISGPKKLGIWKRSLVREEKKKLWEEEEAGRRRS